MTPRRYCRPGRVLVHIIDPLGRAMCGATYALGSTAAADATCPVCHSRAHRPARQQA